MTALPLLIVAVTISAYWLCVGLMVARSWLKFRTSAGAIPKTRLERWLWLIWVPNIIAWVVLPWQAWNAIPDAGSHHMLLPYGLASWGARCVAALLAVAALGLTIHCWLTMGAGWSMAVTPHKKTALLTQGPFSMVRHPIYALSLLLMGCTMIVVTNLPMLLVGVIHIASIVIKAMNEERYLLRTHGMAYEDYCRTTRRFVPGQWRQPTRNAA